MKDQSSSFTYVMLVALVVALAVLAWPSHAENYGKGTSDVSTAATAGTGTSSSNLATGTAGVYYWSPLQKKVLVVNHPSTGASALYVMWNDSKANPSGGSATVSTSNWDAVLGPGESIASPDGLWIKSVGLLQGSGSTKTAGTDFAVRGWD